MSSDDPQLPSGHDEKEMTFLEHLEELRWHLVRSAIAVVIIGIVVFVLKDSVIALLYGPRNQDFITFRLACQYIGAYCEIPVLEIIPREVGERFFTHLKVSLWLGITVAFPYLFWEIWRFIKPGLYEKELKAARGMVLICSSLFFLGVLFGYFIVSPVAISFLAGYTFGSDTAQSSSLSSYVNYLVMITLPTGIIFELPVVAYFLGKIGLISSRLMKKFRRHAIVLIFVLAALITPPDMVTQFLIGIPLIGLYEVGILIVKRIEKKEAEEEARSAVS